MSMNPVQAAWLQQRFGDQLKEVQVEGDEPLLLDDPAYAYITRAAQHQLFCVSHRDGAAHGRREHVALCGAGQLLFGLRPNAEEPAALLLSGVAGSTVWRIPSKRLLELVHEPAGRELVERLFDGFVELLISTLPVAPVPTRCHAVAAGETLPDASATPLRARRGIAWLGLPRTPTRYGALDLSESGRAPIAWPLSETSWALAEGNDVSVKSSGALLASDGGAEFAHGFYAFVMSVLGSRRLALEQARLERDVASLDAERRFVDASLKQLAAVGRGERLTEEAAGGDAFERACRAITDWLGVPPPHIPRPAGKGLSHMQAALSRVTSLRMRGVLLEKGWERHDAGPLLGFLLEGEDELHPVALLPAGGGYELRDAARDTVQRVTPELGERVHPKAYQFYASLPAKPLGPLDVLRFSARGAGRDLALVVVVGMALGSLSTLIPLLTGYVFDTVIPGAERGLLLQLALVLASVYLGQSLFDVARGLALVRVQTRMDATLEAAVWDRLLGLPLPFFRQYSAGDLSSRAAGIGQIRQVLAGATLSALFAALFSLWNFGLLFYISARLAFAATLLVALAAVPVALAAYYGLRQQRQAAAIDGKIGGLLVQLLSGITKLKVSSAENRAFAVWAKLFARRRDADLGTEWINVRVSVFQSAFPLACSVVLFWLMAGAKEKISTGQFLAFNAAFGMFLAALLAVIESGLHSLSVIPLYERAKPILTEEAESLGAGQRVELEGEIEVNHVSFRYETKGPLILDDVGLQIHAGEFVALVGPSGSGKSTLLRLLLGFETPTEGGVFYDGQALSGLDVRVLRQQIGVVMQHSRVMTGDILTNIVGNTGLGIDDAWRAAEQAALADNIRSFPMGMHTVIAQGGGTLSGGQRQRLLIARALAPSPRLLFFDEATSALDNVTQAAVSQSLERLRVTRIVIAHRLSTIRQADKIFVLENGRIAQSGRFDELIAVEGPFRDLAKRQMV